MSTVGLRPVEGKKTIYSLGDEITVRGWATPRSGLFAGHVVVGIWGTERWTELLVHPEGHAVVSAVGRTEQEAFQALNQQCEVLFGEPYSGDSDGPFDWR